MGTAISGPPCIGRIVSLQFLVEAGASNLIELKRIEDCESMAEHGDLWALRLFLRK
jgi:hypothetical protein